MTADILVVAALVLVPGVGAALAFARPGEISIEMRIALAFGLGYAIVAGSAALLALAHAFIRPAFVGTIVAATVAVWAFALRRASPRAHASAFREQAREAPLALLVGLGLLLAVAVTRPLYPAEKSLVIRSSWRYWADSLEAAAAGHVPDMTHQWGTEFPATVSKLVVNSFGGGVSMLLGPDPLPAMQAILVVTTIGVVAALLALGRELGLGIFAPLLPVLVVLVPDRLPLAHELTNDLTFYTAEDMGRLGAFSTLLVGIYAVRRRSRAAAVLTGLLFAVAGLTHLIPTLVAGLILLLYTLGAVILDRGLLRPALVTGAIAAVVFGGAYVAAIGASGGDIGWEGAAGETPSAIPSTIDPSRSFSRGALVLKQPQEDGFLVPPAELLSRLGSKAVDHPVRGPTTVAGLVLVVLLSVALVAAVRSFLPVALIVCGLSFTLLAVAALFSYHFDTVVPGDWGTRRLYGYVAFVPALLAPALLVVLTRPLTRRSDAVLAGLTLIVGLVAVGAVIARIPPDRSLARAEAGRSVIDRVAETVPCGARMLSNARTAGTWEATTGRRALTEGHALFLRPEVLDRALPVLIKANEFFDHPARNRGFLDEQRIDYLVVVEPDVWVGTSGQRAPHEGDAEAIAALPGVHPVVRDRWVSIFAVGEERVEQGSPPPRWCPL
jgi:hypothetical protein